MIDPLPTPPQRSDPANFAARGDAFLAAMVTFGTQANALAVAMNLNSTTDASVSSVLIGTGAKSFTVSAGKSFQPGMYLVIADASAPSTNSMFGQVTSYGGTALVIDVISVRGSGTKAAWVMSQSAPGSAAAGANSDITSLLQAALVASITASAGGTADALTAAFNPVITALTECMTLYVRAAYPNGTTTPNFTPAAGVIAVSTIVKGNNLPLAIGDIAGAGHRLALQRDMTLGKWVLLNPATGVTAGVVDASTSAKGIVQLATSAESIAGTNALKAITPLTLAANNRVAKGWVNFDGSLSGTITPRANVNVASITKTGTGAFNLNVTAPLANANPAVTGGWATPGVTAGQFWPNYQGAATTTVVKIQTANAAGVSTDGTVVNAIIFGD